MATLVKIRQLRQVDEVVMPSDTHHEIDNAGEWGILPPKEILGESTAMRQLKEKIRRLAQGCSTVLIVGETGTGKELVARALHYGGTRRKKTFV